MAAATVDGFKFYTKDFNQDHNCVVDHYYKKEKRDGLWSDLSKLEIAYPLECSFARVKDYFLVISFKQGYNLMTAAVDSFGDILFGEQEFRTAGPIEQSRARGDDSPMLQKHTFTKINLTLAQKVAALVICVATYVRGLFVFLQLGLIFVPFDVVASRIQNRFQKV